METTWLIQRLQKPRVTKGKLDLVAQAFCFGGGGGRLSKQAWEILSPIFSFDYMGAAEFEFGAVPEALSKMMRDRDAYEPFEFAIPTRADGPTIYVFCRKEDRGEVEKRIIEVAGSKMRLKEPAMLDIALDPINEWDSQTCGWLELDNSFAFFTDKTMWEQFCGLFRPESVEA